MLYTVEQRNRINFLIWTKLKKKERNCTFGCVAELRCCFELFFIFTEKLDFFLLTSPPGCAEVVMETWKSLFLQKKKHARGHLSEHILSLFCYLSCLFICDTVYVTAPKQEVAQVMSMRFPGEGGSAERHVWSAADTLADSAVKHWQKVIIILINDNGFNDSTFCLIDYDWLHVNKQGKWIRG